MSLSNLSLTTETESQARERLGRPHPRTESEVRQSLVANLRAEGANDATVARLATDEHVKRMVNYENRMFDLITSMFQPKDGAV